MKITELNAPPPEFTEADIAATRGVLVEIHTLLAGLPGYVIASVLTSLLSSLFADPANEGQWDQLKAEVERGIKDVKLYLMDGGNA